MFDTGYLLREGFKIAGNHESITCTYARRTPVKTYAKKQTR